MREAAARMTDTPTAIISIALMVGLAMGVGFAGVVELRQALLPYKPTSELCKALAP